MDRISDEMKDFGNRRDFWNDGVNPITGWGTPIVINKYPLENKLTADYVGSANII
jgi:hypothetical protein